MRSTAGNFAVNWIFTKEQISGGNLVDLKRLAEQDPLQADAYLQAVEESRVVGTFGSTHVGVQTLFADGSVQVIHRHVAVEILQKLGSRNDGAILSEASF